MSRIRWRQDINALSVGEVLVLWSIAAVVAGFVGALVLGAQP